MAEKRSELALRALAEITVIILGVLVALQVDEWRQGQEARDLERAQIGALRSDFQENIDELVEVIGLQEGLLAAQRQLLGIIHGTAARPSNDSIASLTVRSRSFHRFDPVTGAYDALVASGNLRLIESQELRSELAGFFAKAEGYEDEELSTLYRLELTSAIVETNEFLSMMPAGPRSRLSVPEGRFDFDADRLISSQRFASYLTLVVWTEGAQMTYFRDIKDRADRIVELLGSS